MNENDNATEVKGQQVQLKRDMKTHQVAMISVGGTIGTGLFLGTGYIMQQAGPIGTFIAYSLGALIMVLMMICLGEMLVAMPVAGNAQVYATKFLGYEAGFSYGWIRCLELSVTVPTQIVASAIYMTNIFPTVPNIVWIVGFMLLIFILNSTSSKDFGASSFFFSSFKFILIVLFVIVGFGMIFGLVGDKALGLSNYVNDGGLFPTGIRPILMCMMTSLFAYTGADMFAASASESKNPGKTLPRVIKISCISIIAAYAITLFVLVAVLPWRQADLMGSPFAYAFREAGFKYAEIFVNIIVVTSALSSANAHCYASTRMLWSMGNSEQAPKALGKLNKRSIPMNTLIVTMAFGLFAIAASILSPDKVYLFLTTFLSAASLVIYAIIGISAMAFRKNYVSNGGKVSNLNFKIPLYPLTPILLIALCVASAVGVFFDPTQRLSIIMGVPIFVAVYIVGIILSKRIGNNMKEQ
jgi:amino acid permease